METTLEILTTGKTGRERRRDWPDEVKARIVSESLRSTAPRNFLMRQYASHLDCRRAGRRHKGTEEDDPLLSEGSSG
jgi:transposase-like protein